MVRTNGAKEHAFLAFILKIFGIDGMDERHSENSVRPVRPVRPVRLVRLVRLVRSVVHQLNSRPQLVFVQVDIAHGCVEVLVASERLDDACVDALVSELRHKLPPAAVRARTCDARCLVQVLKQVHDSLRRKATTFC